MQEERRRRFEEFMLGMLFLSSVPTGSFLTLGLSIKATPSEVKSAYRQLALENHPDKGGNQDKFVAINSAYQKALKWATDHNR